MYRLADKQRLLSDQVSKALTACRDRVCGLYPGAKLILYGSQATGRATSESDVDLLILLPEPATTIRQRSIRSLLYDVALEQGVVISSIIRHVDTWYSPLCQAMPLHQAIDREGIEIA